MNGIPLVDSSTLDAGASHGSKSHSWPALPEATRCDLPTPQDAQSHNPPDMVGGAGALGNTVSDWERRLERISCEEDVA